MLKLRLHPDAESDLKDLLQSDRVAFGRIVALLEELESNQDQLENLSDHGFGERRNQDYSVSKWLRKWNTGDNLWRLKIWELESKRRQYRIIYAFFPAPRLEFHVLAVVARELMNYDDDSDPIAQRITRAFEDLRNA